MNKLISFFLVYSDFIDEENRKLFNNVVKIGRFNIENLDKLFRIFIDDEKNDYNFIVLYLKDIYRILITLTKNRFNDLKIPKEWKTSENFNNEYKNFLIRKHLDENIGSYDLLFHDDIFIEKNDNFVPLLKHGLGTGRIQKIMIKILFIYQDY